MDINQETPKRRGRPPMQRPQVSSEAQKELDRAEEQFEAFNAHNKELTMDRMNQVPKLEAEQQTRLSQQELNKSNEIYLKPDRTIGPREKFNENFREQYNFAKEYVKFIAENHEIIGETIELWTKPFAGINAEFWKVPVNKPIWGPRYLAEQIKKKYYHRLVMQDVPTQTTGQMQFYGAMSADTTIQRLDAIPVSTRKSVFMGAYD